MSHTTPIVFVVDDDISMREALLSLICSTGRQTEAFASAEDFLSRPRHLAPSCLILDMTLPELNGLDLQELLADRTDMPIIFISGYGDIPKTVQAMKAGAVEFLAKPFDDQVVLDAVDKAIKRSEKILLLEAERAKLRADHGSLTSREREVMALVVEGLLNKQVADRLCISEITVKAHRGKVMRKMKAKSLADLVTIAARLREARLPFES